MKIHCNFIHKERTLCTMSLEENKPKYDNQFSSFKLEVTKGTDFLDFLKETFVEFKFIEFSKKYDTSEYVGHSMCENGGSNHYSMAAEYEYYDLYYLWTKNKKEDQKFRKIYDKITEYCKEKTFR